jgi:hypothetical protein
MLGEPLRRVPRLASGYSLHHPLRASRTSGGSATIPLAGNALQCRAFEPQRGEIFIETHDDNQHRAPAGRQPR